MLQSKFEAEMSQLSAAAARTEKTTSLLHRGVSRAFHDRAKDEMSTRVQEKQRFELDYEQQLRQAEVMQAQVART